MAIVTRENIGLLHDKLIVKVIPSDYKKAFEDGLNKQAKTANIPGFRKGMVPAGLLRKMYGEKLLTDEIIKAVEVQVNSFIGTQKLNVFSQPLPLYNNLDQLDVNHYGDFEFGFEIGLKPEIDINTANIPVTRYVVTVTDEMVKQEVERLRAQFGTVTNPEAVSSEEEVLNVILDEATESGEKIEGGIEKATSLKIKHFAPAFRETLIGKAVNEIVTVPLATAFEDKEREAVLDDLGLDKADEASTAKIFLLTITKVSFVENAAFDEAFFNAPYPGKEITTEEGFRETVKEDIQAYFAEQSRKQIHDQIYHYLIDNVQVDLPEAFLTRLLEVSDEKQKTKEEAAAAYPTFASQLKWSLISTQLQSEEKVQVLPEDIKAAAKAQLLQYLGGQVQAMGADTQWIEEYAERMLKDKKFVEDSYHRIAADKLFDALETKVSATEEITYVESFVSKLHHHHY
ncbi:trigger factor [Parasediminibacterium sp. JCM 36343]|uniref:trigger factor n=1 Tax=Parasediminibacterium sp. JCM 36343 TaxID=3374279 RepID=UPI0039786364